MKNFDGMKTALKGRGAKMVAALVALIIAAALGALFGYGAGAGSKSGELADAQSKVESLQAAVDSYTQSTSDLQAKLQQYEDVDDAQAKLDDINAQIESQQAQLDSLTGQVDSAKANTVTNGVWQVGVDIPAGTYRATQPVSEDCYWEISTGQGGFDIIDNDIPGGGYPQVTLTDGQHFKLSSCGTWAKQ